MSFNSLLYWLDRAFKGDRRPIWFMAGYIALTIILFIGLKIYD